MRRSVLLRDITPGGAVDLPGERLQQPAARRAISCNRAQTHRTPHCKRLHDDMHTPKCTPTGVWRSHRTTELEDANKTSMQLAESRRGGGRSETLVGGATGGWQSTSAGPLHEIPVPHQLVRMHAQNQRTGRGFEDPGSLSGSSQQFGTGRWGASKGRRAGKQGQAADLDDLGGGLRFCQVGGGLSATSMLIGEPLQPRARPASVIKARISIVTSFHNIQNMRFELNERSNLLALSGTRSAAEHWPRSIRCRSGTGGDENGGGESSGGG